eukprot:Selendium_serpulae@DN609_c0_g1_i1.p1
MFPAHDTDISIVHLWASDVKMRYKNGAVVGKISDKGKFLKRKIHIGAKSEYFEMSSGKLFDTGIHLLDVEGVYLGDGHRNFATHKDLQLVEMKKKAARKKRQAKLMKKKGKEASVQETETTD